MSQMTLTRVWPASMVNWQHGSGHIRGVLSRDLVLRPGQRGTWMLLGQPHADEPCPRDALVAEVGCTLA